MKRTSLARKALSIGAALTLLLYTMAACGGGGSSSAGSSFNGMAAESAPSASSSSSSYGYDSAYYEAPVEEPDEPEAKAIEADVPQSRKMIYTGSLELETTSFEDTVAEISALTDRLGGYFSENTIYSRGSGYRRASYTVRIPVKNFQEFLNQAGSLCHETHRSINADDVSEVYYDTQGRLKTQQIKLERLQALLEQAENMEDIITIESAISETEERIDNLSGTLRHYDDLVAYSTVEVSLEEVYRFSNVEVLPESFGQRLVSQFTEGLKDFSSWVEDLIVALAYSWTWLVLIAVIIFLIVKLVSHRRRKRQEAAAQQGWDLPKKKRSFLPFGRKNKNPDSPADPTNSTPTNNDKEDNV